eukprot:6208960-Pleurochrysis_carterae.AAC.1
MPELQQLLSGELKAYGFPPGAQGARPIACPPTCARTRARTHGRTQVLARAHACAQAPRPPHLVAAHPHCRTHDEAPLSCVLAST